MEITEDYQGPSGKLLPRLQIDMEEAFSRLKSIFQQKKVALAYIFGSYARGENSVNSDIDIAILLDRKGEELYNYYRELLLEIYGALETERVDLILIDDASLSMQFEIISQGQLIYSRDEHELNDFKMNVISKFQDSAHVRKVQDTYLRERARGITFNKESILEQLKRLKEILDNLREKEAITLEKYCQSTDLQWIIERGLEIGSTIILDIGNHILSGAYKIAVDEYEQILTKLHDKKVISSDLYAELRGLEGFRNMLVHGYLKLNNEIVYEHYKKALKFFPKFIAEIIKWGDDYE